MLELPESYTIAGQLDEIVKGKHHINSPFLMASRKPAVGSFWG